MSRDQGVALVKLYDHLFPEKHLSTFLDYYEMTEVEFMNVIDFHANKDILHKVDGRWIPCFSSNKKGNYNLLRKRLIFTLLVQGKQFVLSRNFRLQNVGDIDWLEKHYTFEKNCTEY